MKFDKKDYIIVGELIIIFILLIWIFFNIG